MAVAGVGAWSEVCILSLSLAPPGEAWCFGVSGAGSFPEDPTETYINYAMKWDPDGVDYVIPGNDDAIRAIRLYVTALADAVLDGKAQGAGDVSADEFVEVETEAEAVVEEAAPAAAAEPAETVDPEDARQAGV